MAKFFKYTFGQAGILTPIPNDTQVDGSISYEQGFSTDYTLNPQFDPVTAKEVPLAQTNQYLNDITGAVQQYQTNGFPDFITAVDNDGVPYPYDINSFVRYNDQIYFSLINGNTDIPPSANWALSSATDPSQIVKPALVGKSVSQNLGFAKSLITFDGVAEFDPDGIYVPGNSSFQPIIPGYYTIYGLISSSAGVTIAGDFEIDFYLNGALYKRLGTKRLISAENGDINNSVTIAMNGTTDYIQLYGSFSSVAGENVGGNPQLTYFGINYVNSF